MEPDQCEGESGLHAIRDIPDIVQTIFNTPMSTVQLQQPTGTGQGGRQIREEIDDLLGDLASAPHRHGAPELGDLLHQRPAGTQVVIQGGRDQDAAFPESRPRRRSMVRACS